MNASMRRVAGALRERGLDAEVRELPDSTRTAPEAAVPAELVRVTGGRVVAVAHRPPAGGS